MAYLSCARYRAVKPCGAGRFAGAARALRWVVLVPASRSIAWLSSGLVPSAMSGDLSCRWRQTAIETTVKGDRIAVGIA